MSLYAFTSFACGSVPKNVSNNASSADWTRAASPYGLTWSMSAFKKLWFDLYSENMWWELQRNLIQFHEQQKIYLVSLSYTF